MLVVALTVVLLSKVDEIVAASSALRTDEALAELLPAEVSVLEDVVVFPPDAVVVVLEDVVVFPPDAFVLEDVVVFPPDVVVVDDPAAGVVDSEAVVSSVASVFGSVAIPTREIGAPY